MTFGRKEILAAVAVLAVATLIVVPVVCAYLHEATEWLKRRRARSATAIVAEGMA